MLKIDFLIICLLNNRHNISSTVGIDKMGNRNSQCKVANSSTSSSSSTPSDEELCNICNERNSSNTACSQCCTTICTTCLDNYILTWKTKPGHIVDPQAFCCPCCNEYMSCDDLRLYKYTVSKSYDPIQHNYAKCRFCKKIRKYAKRKVSSEYSSSEISSEYSSSDPITDWNCKKCVPQECVKCERIICRSYGCTDCKIPVCTQCKKSQNKMYEYKKGHIIDTNGLKCLGCSKYYNAKEIKQKYKIMGACNLEDGTDYIRCKSCRKIKEHVYNNTDNDNKDNDRNHICVDCSPKTCIICFTVKKKMKTACTNCDNYVCELCKKKHYNSNKPGCIFKVLATRCIACISEISTKEMKKYNSEMSDCIKREMKLEEGYHHAWCKKCKKIEVYAEVNCAAQMDLSKITNFSCCKQLNKTKCCPYCNIETEKLGGCSQIKCKLCISETGKMTMWCWSCGYATRNDKYIHSYNCKDKWKKRPVIGVDEESEDGQTAFAQEVYMIGGINNWRELLNVDDENSESSEESYCSRCRGRRICRAHGRRYTS